MFSGNNDEVDFYTFKSDFSKIYNKSTPKELLPDLLKNNFLKDPAYSMVRSISNIDEIWKQLKLAYSNVKLLLSKKIDRIGNFESLARLRDPESLAHTLSKLINLVKDLMLLAETHSIEEQLYYGDGIQRIYNLLDDARLSRWLRNINEDFHPKETWKNLWNSSSMNKSFNNKRS